MGEEQRPSDANEMRVNDRRRRYFDETQIPAMRQLRRVPNLKPTYVEELEAATKAAEK